MVIRVLGSSGGICAGRHTTAFLLDEGVLIDAGSGVNQLTADEMAAIRHIFLTHSHLDHIHAIPLMADTIFDKLTAPIVVHALPETIAALQAHIFNWSIWPDFTKLPTPESPALVLQPMSPGETVSVSGRRYRMVPVNHIVPTVGYIVEGESATFAYSGDTTTNDTLWEALNAIEQLDLLIVEVAFPDSNLELSKTARHYCPQLLAADLKKLRHRPSIHITHAKPGDEQLIEQQCREQIEGFEIHLLSGDELIAL